MELRKRADILEIPPVCRGKMKTCYSWCRKVLNWVREGSLYPSLFAAAWIQAYCLLLLDNSNIFQLIGILGAPSSLWDAVIGEWSLAAFHLSFHSSSFSPYYQYKLLYCVWNRVWETLNILSLSHQLASPPARHTKQAFKGHLCDLRGEAADFSMISTSIKLFWLVFNLYFTGF